VHAGHDDVGEEKVDGSRVGRGHLEGMDAVGGLEDRVAEVLEGVQDHAPYLLLVLDHQDRLGVRIHLVSPPFQARCCDGAWLVRVVSEVRTGL